jgi:hypothetical protein
MDMLKVKKKMQRFLERRATSSFSRMYYVVKHWYELQ